MRAFEIKSTEEFPILASAPIVEAVIDIRAFSSIQLEEATARSALETRLTGYNFLDSQHEFQHEVKIENNIPQSPVIKGFWRGIRFQSEDQKHIAQFNVNGFVFSRLAPYKNWSELLSDSQSLWSLFKDIAKPSNIDRIGLRFINRIVLPKDEYNIENYIKFPPAPPTSLELPFIGFLHQEMYDVPGHPYAINLIKTIQPAQDSAQTGLGIIVDIDVFTNKPISQPVKAGDDDLIEMLNQMRWLKDKTFFGSITEFGLEKFK